MKYAEYLPSPRLATLVERFWLLEGVAAGAADAIIPDGRVELIFHYGAPFWRHEPRRASDEAAGVAPRRPDDGAGGARTARRRGCCGDSSAAGRRTEPAGIFAAGGLGAVCRSRGTLSVAALALRSPRRGPGRHGEDPRPRRVAARSGAASIRGRTSRQSSARSSGAEAGRRLTLSRRSPAPACVNSSGTSATTSG